MIILFHMAYVIASSLVNIISRSFFKNVSQQIVNDDIHEEEQINEPISEQEFSSMHVHNETSKTTKQKNGMSSGLGEEQTADDSSLRSRPYHIQGDGQGYLPAQPYVSASFENEDCDVDFRPIPPVYAQRYLAVKGVLLDEKWNGQIKKVIDFGCNDLAFFQYVKHMKGVQEVLLVDIDETLLKQSSCRVAPLNCDYLGNRESPLFVQILSGSIAEQDSRLIGTDAVICIELIEHLWPDEVESVPYTVFGFILPKVAIFTTPNADFNVVFKNFSGFRHPDHKFEWTREQFECWANNIVHRYPAYEVTFHGIGAGPPGTEVYGCCSQMAVFVKRFADTHHAKIEAGEAYKLICDYNYPFRVDNRTMEEKIRHEAEYYIHRYSKDEVHYLEDGNIEIPLITLLPHVEMWCNSIEDLRKILEGATWKISDRNPEIPAVVYPYYSPYSSSDEEEEEHDVSFLSQDKFIDEDSFQLTEDWDECAVSRRSFVNGTKSSSQQPQLNGWNEVDCRGETIVSLPIKVMGETGNFKETSTSCLLPDVGMTQNSEQSSFLQGIEGAMVPKSGGSAFAVNNAKQSDEGGAEDDGSSNGANVASEGTSQLGTLFRSNVVNRVSEGDSAIVMAGKPSCVRSLGDVAFADHPSSPADHLPSPAGRAAYREVPSDYFMTSSEESVAGSSASLLPGDSSRSFFLGLLSSERQARRAEAVSEQGMDLDQDDEESGGDSEDSSSGRSQEGYDPPPRRAQPHRDHLPFGLNAVENGDVANNNRDGEGNNAVPLLDDDEDEDEMGDHEDDDLLDEDNANNVLLPDGADPFPPWLLHLLQVANDDGIELGAAGEPHIFLGDLV